MDFISSSHEVFLFDDYGEQIPCVGTILTSHLILTLASCFYGKTVTSDFTVRTKGGQKSNSKWGKIKGIGRIFIHPDFKKSSSENDIAILGLTESLHHDCLYDSNAELMPVLNSQDESPFMNSRGRVCGKDLEFSPLEISDSSTSECPPSAFESDKLCLLPLNSKETSPSCSKLLPGSSLICSSEYFEQYLCGVLAASLELENGREYSGQVYTNVRKYSNWIQFTKPVLHTSCPLVGGGTVDPRDPLPYQLSIQFQFHPPDGPKIWHHICGAVILDESTAITAAHCFDDSTDIDRYFVVAAEYNLNDEDEGEKILKINKLDIHPGYTRKGFVNGSDIAILHLGTKILFGKHAQNASLSRTIFSNQELASPDPDTNKVTISGWGQTSNNDGVSNLLQMGKVSIVGRKNCLSRLEKNNVTAPGIWCALDRKTRTCRGDSGGPLIIQKFRQGNSTVNLLLGIVSFGAIDCDIQNTAIFFTEIGYFYNWIQVQRKKKEEEEKEEYPVPVPIIAPITTPRTIVRTSKKPSISNRPVIPPPPSPSPSSPNGNSKMPGSDQVISSSSSTSCVNEECTVTQTKIYADGRKTTNERTYNSGTGGQGQNVHAGSFAFAQSSASSSSGRG